MLKSVSVIVVKVVIIIGIEEKLVVFGEDESRTDVGARQAGLFRVAYFEHVALVVLQVAAHFVAQVGGGFAVAYHFGRRIDADGAVVGSDEELHLAFGGALQGGPERGVEEPGAGERAVGFLIAGQFFEYLHFGAGVRHHVDEIIHDDGDVVVEVVEDIVLNLFGLVAAGDLDVIAFDFLAESAFDQFAEKYVFMQVFAALFVVVLPPVGEALGNIHRHEAGEDGIAAVLGGGGQDAVEEVLFLHAEALGDDGLNDLPLIVAQVVQKHEQRRLAILEVGKYLAAHQLVGHHGAVAGLYPI